MYEKPKLERFGTFRELTKLGSDSDGDGGIYIGLISTTIGDGCNANWVDPNHFSCSR